MSSKLTTWLSYYNFSAWLTCWFAGNQATTLLMLHISLHWVT